MEHSIHLYSMTPSVCQREKERGWVWNRMRLHSYPEGEEMWKNIKRTWTSNLTELHKISFQPLIIKIHKGLMVGLISYIWISALLFHKDTKKGQPENCRGATLAFNECTNCFFTVFFNVLLLSCWDLHQNEMSYFTTLPASGTVYFLVFW